MIVTDHHRPGETLPDCPIVATRPSDYPFPDLCGTGVVHKLAQALLGADHPAVTRHLDLVALATIADVVPLVDENRALASAGLRALARTQKPGLRALMRVAGVDPATVDATAVGFRLAPRINAAGRLGRPDVGLQLVLTRGRREADQLADELETLNRDRQAVEERILREAVAVVECWPAEQRRRRGYVLWGEDWHEGVIGIVASRLVERFHRPVVLIAGEGEAGRAPAARSRASTSTRASQPAPTHLERFGGHRAAAGLTIRADELEAFAAAFAAHADAELAEDDLRPSRGSTRSSRLGAHARACPGARPARALRARQPRCDAARRRLRGGRAATVGEGKHLRFRVRQHGRDAGSAIAFGLGGQLERLRGDGRYDVAFRLKENRWNGTVAPQLVVRRLFDTAASYEVLRVARRLWRAGERPGHRRRGGSSPSSAHRGAAGSGSSRVATFRALLEHGAPITLPQAA